MQPLTLVFSAAVPSGWIHLLHTADAEEVAVQLSSRGLVLPFIDCQERPRRAVFTNVLAFRWQEFDEKDIRDDVVYEVRDSGWLAQQAKLQAVDVEGYVHHKLCFNACGTLDLLCRCVGEAA